MIIRNNPKALPFPRKKLAGSLLLAASVALAQPGLADASDAIELDELEVTLEIFDDSADLEAFELRLVAIRADDDLGRGDEWDERDELAERMERFEEAVAAAGEDREELEDRARDGRERAAEEAEEEMEEILAREHENERLEEIAEFDSRIGGPKPVQGSA